MENISVSVRVRPLNEHEEEKGLAWKIDNNKILPAGPLVSTDSAYNLDYVFDSEWSTQKVYEHTTEDIIKKVVGGFNGTVFAYGQTSSGKTHTMRGTKEEPGIIPLAVAEIFNRINNMQDREFLLRVSYMELYNEDINDLLAKDSTKLQIHESKEAGVHVAGLREEIVTGAEHVLELLYSGEAARHIGETKMNKASSRSHSVFRMVVESRSRDPESSEGGAVWVSTLTLVDLAGSERIAKTGAEGLRMKEGASINKSLLTLGTVINKLSEGAQAQGGHIPYRDSKLTRILQPSLGGNAKTAIICNITPAQIHQEESHSTLRFACRAKRVVNNAMVNEVVSDAAVLKRQAKEIEELRKVLAANGNTEIEAQIATLRAELLHKEQENEIVQLQLAKEREDREKAERQVHGLTKLMLGQGSASEGEGKPRKENRRETWAPGLAGKGNRKRPLASQLEHVMEDGKAGRKSEMLTSFSVLSERNPTTMSPAYQKQRSLPGVEEEAESLPKFDLASKVQEEDSGEVGELRARIKELETEQVLIQRELDSVSDAAQRADEQLRNAEDELVEVANERDQLVPQNKELAWQNRHLDRHLQELKQVSETLEKDKEELISKLEVHQAEAGQQQNEARETTESLKAEISSLRTDLAAVTKTCRDAESAIPKLTEEHKAKVEKLEIKADNQRQELANLNEKLRQTHSSADESRKQFEDLQEKLDKSAERERDLYETNKRLENHIQDLESRKRAPLYQKKQEEELRAQTEKAQEAEIRAQDAELRCKEAKAAKLEADKKALEAEEVAEKLQKDLELAAAESASNLEDLQRRHDQTVLLLKEDYQQEAEGKEAVIEALQDEVREKTKLMEDQSASNFERQSELQSQVIELSSHIRDLEISLGETQACADAASERIQGLEEEAQAQSVEQDKELNELQREKEAQKAEADQAFATLASEKTAEIEALKLSLEGAQRAVIEKGEEMEAERKRAADALNQASAEATAEHEALQARLTDSLAVRSDLEAKVARAATSLKAADDLKEAKRQHREEMTKLQQQLKSSSVASKGGAVEAERAKKELEKLREKLQNAEAKCRGLVQEKNQAVQEKGNFEREIKQLRGTTERLTKDLSKRESAAEKKLEVLNGQLAQFKSQLTVAESSVTKLQAEVDQTVSALSACQGERDSFALQAEELEKTKSSLLMRQDHLETQIANLNDNLQATTDKLSVSEATIEDTSGQLSKVTAQQRAVEIENNDLTATIEQLEILQKETSEELATKLNELSSTQEDLKNAQAEADHSKEEVATCKQEIQALMENATALKTSGETQAQELQEKIAELGSQVKEKAAEIDVLVNDKGTAEFQVQEAEVQMAELQESFGALKAQKEAQEAANLKYQQELEGQLNEMELENQTHKASVEDFRTRFAALQSKSQTQEEALGGNTERIAEMTSQLANLTGQLEEKTSELQDSQRQLQTDQEQRSQMEAQLSDAKATLKASVEANQKQKSELEALAASKQVSEAEYDSQLQEAISSAEQWKAFAEKLETGKAEMEASLQLVSDNLQSIQAKLSEAELQLSEKSELLESKTNEIGSTASQAKAEEDRLLALLSQVRGEAEQAKTDSLAEQSYLKEVSSQEIMQLESKLASVEGMLQDAKSELQSTQAMQHESESRKQAQLAAVQEELSSSQRSGDELREDLHQQTAETSLLRQSHNDALDRIQDLKTTIDSYAQQVSSLERSVASAETSKAASELDAKHAAESADLNLVALQQEIEVLKGKAGSEKNRALQELKEHHAKALNEEQKRSSAVQAELNARIDDLADNLEKRASEAQSLLKAKSVQDSQKETVEKQLHLLKEKYGQVESKLTRADAQTESWKSRARELQKNLDSINTEVQQISRLQTELAQSERSKADCEEQVQMLLTEVTVLKGETARLRTQLDHTATVTADSQATPAQLAAERKVAELHGKLHAHESKLRQLSDELARLRSQNPTSLSASGACAHCPALESELRKCKRAQEKMTAIQFRLRNDVEKAGGDLNKLDQHKSLLQMEYELDFQKNRFKKEIQALQKELSRRKVVTGPNVGLSEKENAPLTMSGSA